MNALRTPLLAASILFSAAVVVAAFNPAPHTGGDNAGYVALAYSLVSDGSYTELFDPARAPHTKYPPVFPALLAALMLLGARTWAVLKSVAAVSTVAAVGLAYLWSERRLSPVWALGISLALAMASSVVYYSHWILSDPTFVAVTLLALLALERADEEGAPSGWVGLGVLAAGLAYFTRSAGLPLLVALLAWLALRRRWRALAVSAVTLAVPIALWMLRARGAGQGEYVSEFWLVDPYDPALGRVGLAGLAGRVVENLVGYVGTHLPGGIVGTRGPAVAALGVALVVLGLAGWVQAARKRVGPAELFLPLYAGLILLWPVVWSGDRFALPLYPLLFCYAAMLLRSLVPRLGRLAPAMAGAAALLVVLLPAGRSLAAARSEAVACSETARALGPFGCWGPRVGAFVEAATWAGSSLPDGSAVLTRKPRIFYVLSGVPSRTFPFSERPEDHLGTADAVGARYELLDVWDGLAGRYVLAAVSARPGAYCAVRAFGDGSQLLGILPPEQRGEGVETDEQGRVRIALCPASYLGDRSGAGYSPSSSTIPLLRALDPTP